MNEEIFKTLGVKDPKSLTAAERLIILKNGMNLEEWEKAKKLNYLVGALRNDRIVCESYEETKEELGL